MTDQPRRLNPVLMFDDRDTDPDPNVKDFRPIRDYVEEKRGKSRISDAPEADPRASDVVPDPTSEPEQPDEAPDHDPGIAPPEVTQPDVGDDDDIPPATAPEPDTEPDTAAGGDDGDDDGIPSPWDEDM
jgi:hypothetical protein